MSDSLGISIEEQAALVVFCAQCRNCDIGALVSASHGARFGSKVTIITLDDAQTVDPDIVDAQVRGQSH